MYVRPIGASSAECDRTVEPAVVLCGSLGLRNLLRKLLGDRGERAAVKFLRSKRYRILARQHRNSLGEIDIIAEDGRTTVFVEVKTRANAESGQPFEAVDQRKQQKITLVALEWLKRYRRLEQPSRFDVVSILWPDDGRTPEIQHFQNAFEPVGKGQFFR